MIYGSGERAGQLVPLGAALGGGPRQEQNLRAAAGQRGQVPLPGQFSLLSGKNVEVFICFLNYTCKLSELSSELIVHIVDCDLYIKCLLWCFLP